MATYTLLHVVVVYKNTNDNFIYNCRNILTLFVNTSVDRTVQWKASYCQCYSRNTPQC